MSETPIDDFDAALAAEESDLAQVATSAPRFTPEDTEREPITFEGRVVDKTEIAI